MLYTGVIGSFVLKNIEGNGSISRMEKELVTIRYLSLLFEVMLEKWFALNQQVLNETLRGQKTEGTAS